jgi:hypothetical protein
MGSWTAFLAPIAPVSDGAAILALTGTGYGKQGGWKASSAEEQSYAALLKDPSNAQAKGLSYNNKKYTVTRAIGETIIAQLAKEGIVLQQTSSLIVAAHYGEGQTLNSVSSRVAQVVSTIAANGG